MRLRHSRIFARADHDHYVEPLWCSQHLFAVESFGPLGARVLDLPVAGDASCAPPRTPGLPHGHEIANPLAPTPTAPSR